LPPGYGLRFIKVPEETADTIQQLLGMAAMPAPTEPATGEPLPAPEVVASEASSHPDGEELEGPPYRLIESVVSNLAPEAARGVFVLSYDRTQDARVGRADESLRAALLGFVGEYAYFYHEILDRTDERYYRECELFHRLGGDHGQLDNLVHPEPPEGSDLSCPVCPLGKNA
jgi:hypothetical protein